VQNDRSECIDLYYEVNFLPEKLFYRDKNSNERYSSAHISCGVWD